MNSKKEEKKSLNYNFEQNKDFSFRNDDINDENQNPNKTLISSGRQSYSNSKNSIQINFDNDNNLFQKNKKVKKPNNMDLLNQLVVNRLIQENKYLKQELEMAKSNILILEEKESQYKSTIEHINNMNNGKEISHKNIISLINNYKKRENEFKQIIKDSKNNFSYEVKNTALDNKVSIKINATKDILDRIVNYKVTFSDGKHESIVKNLWKLSKCDGDGEEEIARCLSVNYIDLKSMKSENNVVNTITVDVVAYYDNGCCHRGTR